MLVYPRSYWTALVPRPSTLGDQFVGLPYFSNPPVGVTFHPVGKNLLYSYRNPASELNLLVKETTNQTGLSDINYNYAIAQNTRGVYVLRGAITKCMQSEEIRVLMLIGENEKPTDVLKENQRLFNFQNLQNPIPPPVLKEGDSNVHVFDLIELLAQHNFYQARNDGVYGPICKHAVTRMQLELDLPNLTGVYDEWVHNKLIEADREFIRL